MADRPDSELRDQYGFKVSREELLMSRTPSQLGFVGRIKSVVVKPSSEKWNSYKHLLAPNVIKFKKDSTLTALVRYVGIPLEHRKKLWPLFCGAAEYQYNNQVAYRDIIETHGSEPNAVTNQIDLDLRRTFPTNKLFESEAGIQSLRNILVAFSWVNPAVGYCQSQNFWTAFLLLFVEEELSFWIARRVIEHMLPMDYYTDDMIGVMIDARVTRSLIDVYLPKIHSHLNNIGVDISTIVSQWYLCIFVTLFPNETAVRFFDIFMYEGSKALFRAALATFKLFEDEILKLDSFEKAFPVISRLPSRVTDIAAWVDSCFDKLWLLRFNRSRIASLRESHREQVQEERAALQRQFARKEYRRARVNGPASPLTPEAVLESALASEPPDSPPRKTHPPGYRPKSWKSKTFADMKIIDDYVDGR